MKYILSFPAWGGAQAGVTVAINGHDFANRTLYSQAYRPRHQSLLSGQVYYVTVQATSRNAARLTANATSAGVKARSAAAPCLLCRTSM